MYFYYNLNIYRYFSYFNQKEKTPLGNFVPVLVSNKGEARTWQRAVETIFTESCVNYFARK